MVFLEKEDWKIANTTDFVGKTIRLFLSYSAIDKRLAGEIKSLLSSFDIRVFLAHEDIEPLQDWEEDIIHNLDNCDVFVSLLTKNFLKSEWTSQEIGIAFSKQKLIIPLQFDIAPYGFIRKKQGLNARNFHETVSKILEIISEDRILKENLKDCLIQSLSKAYNFDDAATRLDILEKFDFDRAQINEIFRMAILNNQVRMSSKGKFLCEKWLSEYSQKLNPDLIRVFKKVKDEF